MKITNTFFLVLLPIALTNIYADNRRLDDPSSEDQKSFLSYAKAALACYEADPTLRQEEFDESGECGDNLVNIWVSPSANDSLEANAWYIHKNEEGSTEYYGTLSFKNSDSQKCFASLKAIYTGEDITLKIDSWYNCDGVEQKNLASDLKVLETLILSKTVLESEQDDFTLGLERVDLKPKGEYSTVTQMVTPYEWSLIEKDNDLNVDTFKVELVGAYDSGSTRKALTKLYNYLGVAKKTWRPFYCRNFKTVSDDEEETTTCRAAVGEVLKQVLKEHSIVVVQIEGDSWGDYAATNIYIQSNEKPEQFLRLAFDIVHEI